MLSHEIRSKFLKFFENKGHKIVPSSALLPENDPSVLFTTAGMQQFKQYYTNAQKAEQDFGSRNVVSVQKCVRTVDIEEVGDHTHLTFFEMLGNFSFGGYWKEEAIAYAYEFITRELGLTIDYVSVFEGDSETPADNESREIWSKLDPNLTIKDHNRADNFWGPTGEEGPCGPTTEIYINGVEIWNIVFNEFYKTRAGEYKPLEVRGIDTGMGLERLLVQIERTENVYDLDLFNSAIQKIDGERKDMMEEEKMTVESFRKRNRIIADHLRTVMFMVSEGVRPGSNKREYVLRRLMRRIMGAVNIKKFANEVFAMYQQVYAGVYNLDLETTKTIFWKEFEDFKTNSDVGFKEIFKKYVEGTGSVPPQEITGGDAFNYLSTYGITKEAFLDQIEATLKMNMWMLSSNFNQEYEEAFTKHQDKSRTASAGMFKGGLANHNERTVRLHTAHHLLLAALQSIVSPSIKQEGSNINEERLRLDFLCDHKLTDEEKKKVEEWVNDKIKAGLEVVRREMPFEKARKIGAQMEFGAKYPEVVSVYFIEDKNGEAVSKEFCGGPHVSNTSELGVFKIVKEEAVAQGIRRIKATLA